MTVFLIRFTVFLLGAAAVGLSAVPILVMIDLLGGGTGYGLCANGLEFCDNPYSTAPELAVLLAVGLFLMVLLIRLLMKLARRLRDESYQVTQ